MTRNRAPTLFAHLRVNRTLVVLLILVAVAAVLTQLPYPTLIASFKNDVPFRVQKAAESIGLNPPLGVRKIQTFYDGGTRSFTLHDTTGRARVYCVDGATELVRPEDYVPETYIHARGVLYSGADHPSRSGATWVRPGSAEARAVDTILTYLIESVPPDTPSDPEVDPRCLSRSLAKIRSVSRTRKRAETVKDVKVRRCAPCNELEHDQCLDRTTIARLGVKIHCLCGGSGHQPVREPARGMVMPGDD